MLHQIMLHVSGGPQAQPKLGEDAAEGELVTPRGMAGARLACSALHAALDAANPALAFHYAKYSTPAWRFMPELQVARLKRMLRGAESLRHLAFVNQQSDYCCATLAEMLADLSRLESLDLSYNALGRGDSKMLLQAISSNTVIQRLNLSGNWREWWSSDSDSGQDDEEQPAVAGGAEQLATLMKLNTSILHLNLSNNVLPAPRTSLFGALGANTKLQGLDLRRTYLSEAEGCQLFSTLRMNSTLQRLDLRANPSMLSRNSSAMLTEMLTEMLEVNITLTHLKLNGTPDACTSVAKALQRNSTLRHLELREGGLGVAGWLALARMLRVNTTLRHLDLRGCDKIRRFSGSGRGARGQHRSPLPWLGPVPCRCGLPGRLGERPARPHLLAQSHPDRFSQ